MSSETISYPHLEREQQIIDHHLLPKIITEFVGTFFLVFSIAICQSPYIALGVGFSLIATLFMGGHLSGAHYNPCVSVAVWLRQLMTPKELLIYIVTQLIAGIIAGATAYGIQGTHAAMKPGPTYSDGSAFAVELIWTFLLISTALNVATTKSQEDNSYFGLAVAAVIVGGIICVGDVSGACFNPAIGTGLAITDGAVGGDSLQYLWIYWIAPMCGSVLAALVFRVMNAREFKTPLVIGTKQTSSSANKPLLRSSSINDGSEDV